MFLQKHLKTIPMETGKGPCKIKYFFRTLTIGFYLILVWEYVEFLLEFITS
jgi:hypothetical protein